MGASADQPLSCEALRTRIQLGTATRREQLEQALSERILVLDGAMGSLIQSYGVSGRLTVERAAIFRADFGFSSEGFNFSAGFGLAF